MSISEATYCNWKKKYGGLAVPKYRCPPHLGPLACQVICLQRAGWACTVHTKVLRLRSLRPKCNQAAAHPLARLPMGRLHQRWRRDFVCCNKAYSSAESSYCLKAA
jgi:hypothetical protein